MVFEHFVEFSPCLRGTYFSFLLEWHVDLEPVVLETGTCRRIYSMNFVAVDFRNPLTCRRVGFCSPYDGLFGLQTFMFKLVSQKSCRI